MKIGSQSVIIVKPKSGETSIDLINTCDQKGSQYSLNSIAEFNELSVILANHVKPNKNLLMQTINIKSERRTITMHSLGRTN